MVYSEQEILEKQQLAGTFNLSGSELLDDINAVRRDCNGIGAEWFPPHWRELLSGMFPELEVVADIHDRRYSIGGSCFDRWTADLEFFRNGIRIAVCIPNLSMRRRFRLFRTVFKMYLLLAIGGATAFNYAGKGRQ